MTNAKKTPSIILGYNKESRHQKDIHFLRHGTAFCTQPSSLATVVCFVSPTLVLMGENQVLLNL